MNALARAISLYHLKIRALKYPNIHHYEWHGEILEKTNDYIIVLCKPGRKIIHHTKNDVFIINTTSIEYFSLNEWYTAAFEIEDGRIVSVYCNVGMPSVISDNEVSFVDLDLDYVKRRDQDWEVIDIDEFEMNRITYQYPKSLIDETINALEKLKSDIENKSFPFDENINALLNRN